MENQSRYNDLINLIKKVGDLMNSLKSLKISRFKHMLSLIFASKDRTVIACVIFLDILSLSLDLVDVKFGANHYVILSQIFSYVFFTLWILECIYSDLSYFLSLGYKRKEFYNNIFKIFAGVSALASIMVLFEIYIIKSEMKEINFLGVVFQKFNVYSILVIFILGFIIFMSLSVLANDLIMIAFGKRPTIYLGIAYIIIATTMFGRNKYAIKLFDSKLHIIWLIGGIVFIYLSYKYGLKAFKNKDIKSE